MREEKVTVSILKWLEKNEWEIISYDFPQSGTGILLHKNKTSNIQKNKGGIIPDIIARKANTVLFFENKDRFFKDDFIKIQNLRTNNEYTNSISKILGPLNYLNIFFGVGIPEIQSEINKCVELRDKIDFLLSVKSDFQIKIYLGAEIFNKKG